MLKPHRLLTCAALVTALCGCATPPACRPGLQAMTTEWLYFGTERPGGTISAAEWKTFADEVVTPRFPKGLSVWPAAGQWQSAAGPVVRESSYVLNIVHAGSVAEQHALDEITGSYKSRFQQEAVLRVSSPACVGF